ncbi:hypothetical protein LZ554_001369 [Drepanopeziza brunnea f. sp. 'monogermtubi']|nr:hypothetical protein LZ554_001369 [Drepanopeziza brunnea f. sp. 'monogermtubi']
MASSFNPSWDRNSPRRHGALGRLVQRSPDRRYEIRSQTLFAIPSDAIVNGATADMRSSTLFRPGRRLRLAEAAGPGFDHYLAQQRYHLRVGDAITTPRFEIRNCRRIIHTNVPRWGEVTHATAALLKQQLVNCYRSCLEEAQRVGADSVAFPCLGADDTSGWRRRDAARIGVNTSRGMGVEVGIDAGAGADFAGLPHPPYVSPALELGQENVDSPTRSIEQDDAQGEVEGGDTEDRSRRRIRIYRLLDLLSKMQNRNGILKTG